MKAKTYKPTFLICPSCNNETDTNISEAVRSNIRQFVTVCNCCGQRFDVLVHAIDDVEIQPAGRVIQAWNLIYVPAMMEHPLFMVAENPITIPDSMSSSQEAVDRAVTHTYQTMSLTSPRLVTKIVGFHAMKEQPIAHERTITEQSQLVRDASGYLSVPDTFPEVRDMVTLIQSTGAGLPCVKH